MELNKCVCVKEEKKTGQITIQADGLNKENKTRAGYFCMGTKRTRKEN